MFPSFLLSLREGLEAALIIGIILGALHKLHRGDLKPVVWRGVGLAVALSLLAGLGLNLLGMEFEGVFEEVFEGIAMLLAAGILTWMIFWMQSQGGEIRSEIEAKTRQAALQKGGQALFILAFLAVFREGIELALFLMATRLATSPMATFFGAILGLVAAIALGLLVFSSTRRLNLRQFFLITNVLLLLFAAGLIAHGIHEFNEAGWIPSIVEPLWDVNHILNDKSPLGEILKALFGYNGNPSLTEVLAYVGYFAILGTILIRNQRKQPKINALPVQ
jgi:high-affinity iron transporter